jgi:hypothetical protein
MRVFRRKSQMRRLRDTVSDAVEAPMKKVSLPSRPMKKVGLPSGPPDKTVKTGLIVAGGLAGLTWVSAGISSLRRHSEEANVHS